MATDVKRAVHNPFRSNPVSPISTGAGPASLPSLSVSSPGPDPQPQPEPEPRQTTTTTPPEASSSNGQERERECEREHSPPRQNRRSADDLAAELQSTTLDDEPTPSEPPPAYTPSANPYEGEATVEYGPTRPFQPAPPAPPLPQQFTGMSGQLHPQYSGMPPQSSPYLSPQLSGGPFTPNHTGGWSSYPGQGVSSSSSLRLYGPPPQHPQRTGYHPVSPPRPNLGPAQTGNTNGMSEFARDFYASSPVDRQPSPVPSNGSSDDATGPEHFERMGPNVSVSAPPSSYAPPPGPPPSARASSSSSSHAPPEGPPPQRASSEDPNDCRPTTSPTPGHPLLNKGRILVYPRGFLCKKCSNTGYKAFDPTHPCRKCWEKYSKPYSGAIVYAPHSAQSQRPLPKQKPPHLGHQPSQSQPSLFSPPSSSSPDLFRSQSTYRPSPWQRHSDRPFPTACMGSSSSSCGFSPPQRPLGMASPIVNPTYGRPPPGSVVVKPGDPRIGGRLCWRCDGSGTVSFLIFDVEQCPVCRGVGRIFS